ncbi:hypothetical protein NNC19_01680 [Clostridium sp. SHJSY1]|uniref:hypothetical protein n=1 Tax=Clostridium sp. SHJSY1 TaxID=2942483 RepID=UPI002874652F|nr:hypothetical protein [Clostridium sp. SHJSY1]MDS0524369.1 hypothetical protein [Clostridium sp. SHJSY1]
MSLFLGKIHYWLFNKIVWFENLESEIIELAKVEGLDTESLRKVIEGKYGERTPNLPLEDMIDTSNIHGWLQGKIHSAEGRMAAWTTEFLKKGDEAKNKLKDLYEKQGIKAAEELKENGGEAQTAPDLFNAINDYILDGMPCDRVNEVVDSDENKVTWVRTLCVHKDIWEKESGDVDFFYHLRSLWVKAFVTNVNEEFEYLEENESMTIRRK